MIAIKKWPNAFTWIAFTHLWDSSNFRTFAHKSCLIVANLGNVCQFTSSLQARFTQFQCKIVSKSLSKRDAYTCVASYLLNGHVIYYIWSQWYTYRQPKVWSLLGPYWYEKVHGLTEHIMPYNMPELDKRFRIHPACMYSADDTAHVLHGKN
jgi:hypothetical protein